MHLLRTDTDGRLSLETFYGESIPPYTVLSHTWGRDEDEVSYHDLKYGGGALDKPGYKKLDFCAHETDTDELEYFWASGICTKCMCDIH
jgi:hypothetical protein